MKMVTRYRCRLCEREWVHWNSAQRHAVQEHPGEHYVIEPLPPVLKLGNKESHAG